MSERTVTYLGDLIVHLDGQRLTAGDEAPEVTVQSKFHTPFDLLGDTPGKIRLVSSVPSLDTAICNEQTMLLSKEVAEMGDEFAFITVSMDLPFAQDRWCSVAGVPRNVVLSDYRDGNFGMAYGTTIRELRILHRALFVVDDENFICYVQYLPEVHEHPDYATALAVLKGLA
ncbi:MAG: thiol peroxidase [Anaerolineae bacterium]|nr:thiol peroxidase [Anaerolineae bacterium]